MNPGTTFGSFDLKGAHPGFEKPSEAVLLKQHLDRNETTLAARMLNEMAGDRSPLRFAADETSHLISVFAQNDSGTSLMNVYTGGPVPQLLGPNMKKPDENLAVTGRDMNFMRAHLPGLLMDLARQTPESGESPRDMIGIALNRHLEAAGVKAPEMAGRLRPPSPAGLQYI